MSRPSRPSRNHACRHCGYAVPVELAQCPGCGRRHRRRGRPAIASDWDLLGLWPATPPALAGGMPAAVVAPARTARTAPPAPYRSLLSIALPLRALLWLTGALALVTGAVRGSRLVVTYTAHPWPVARPHDFWAQSATTARGLAGATLFAIAATGVVFVAWALQAYTNLPALGITNRRYWTAWAVLGWLVPGANLFVPKLLIDDVWRASSPSLPPRPSASWQRRPVGDIVTLWWTLWLATPAVAVVVTTLLAQAPSELGQTRIWEAAAFASGLALAGAAAAARQMVGVITVAQAQRADAVGATHSFSTQ